jgi:hypothetical protein
MMFPNGAETEPLFERFQERARNKTRAPTTKRVGPAHATILQDVGQGAFRVAVVAIDP